MAAITLPITSLSVPVAQTLFYTVTAGEEHCVTVTSGNNAIVNQSIALWIVPAGGTPNAGNLRIPNYVLLAKEPRDLLRDIPLPPGTMIYAQASTADTISIQLTGRKRII